MEPLIWLKPQHSHIYRDGVVVLVALTWLFSHVNSVWIGKTVAHLSLTEMLTLFLELLAGTLPGGD